MQRFFIILVNCALLALLLVGIPAATRAQLGNWQISRAPTNELLKFWGLGLAAGGNILAVLFLIKESKARILGCEWAAVFSGLWFVQYAFSRGWLNFDWLKTALEWCQKYF